MMLSPLVNPSRSDSRRRADTAVRRMLYAAALLAFASIANAQWSGTGNLLQVFSHDGYIFLQTTIADSPCSTAGKFWFPTSDPDAKDMYAMALTALTADKTIAVVYDENAPNCIFGGQLSTVMAINR